MASTMNKEALAESAKPFLKLRVIGEAEFEGKTLSLAFMWDEYEGVEKFQRRCDALRWSIANTARSARGDYGDEVRAEARSLAGLD